MQYPSWLPYPSCWLRALILFLINLIPIYIIVHIDQLLWGKPHPKFPDWLPNPASLIEGTVAWIIILFSMLMTVALLCDDLDSYSVNRYSYRYNHLIQAAPTIWIVLAAYLYQLRYLIMRLIKKYQSGKS